MPYCQQCGAGVDGFAMRCRSCKRDPFPPVIRIVRCPACEREQDPDWTRCPDCDVELEITEEPA